MTGSSTKLPSSIATPKTTEGADPTASDSLSPSEKRSLAAKKGWERKRELEKNAGPSKKMRITPSRSARSAAKIAAAAIASPPQPQPKAKIDKRKSDASSIARKGWETRKKKMAAAASASTAAAVASSSSSSSSTKTKSLTHSEAAKLGWERIRKKKALEEAKVKAAAASKKKASTTKTAGLSRSEAAKLGWERIRAKKMQDEAADAEDDEDDVFKARSKSSKLGWETRRKKKAMQGKKAKVADAEDEVKDELFEVRSKSSKKGWETRRKLAEAAARQEVKDTEEWQQRSIASKKGWATRRSMAEAASKKKSAKVPAKKSKSMEYAPIDKANAAKLDWERKRKAQDMLGESSPELSTVAATERSPKKPYTAAARSKAAKMAWQKAKEQKMLMTGTATAPSGRAYYQVDSSVATHTYTAERVEWEIRQKMLAAANDDEDSSEEEGDEESSGEEVGTTEEEHEEEEEVAPAQSQWEEKSAADISRDEAANLLLAMFGNNAPVAPAPKAEDTSADETSQETSIAEALQELKGVKSEETSFSVENYGEVQAAGDEQETSMRGRKRKPTAKGSGYKHMMHNEDELAPFVKAPSVKSSSVTVNVKPSSLKPAPRSPNRAASKKTSKQRSNTAKQGWQKRKNEVFKKSSDPQESEKINAAIASVQQSALKTAGKEASLPRGVTVRPSGKWQAQLYYAGKSRYIGVFDSREDACYAYEVARQVLMFYKDPKDEEVEMNISLARKAAFAGVSK